MLPEPRLARQIIEGLGQFGTPVSKGVSYYNVGNELLLNAIDAHYLGSYLADGGAVFKLVVGDYGSGKSHFLYCIRDRAWQRNFAVSKVDLSPRESPYDDQRRVYAAVASSMIWHELGDLGEDERGLTRFLEGTLRRLIGPHGLDLDDPAAADLPEARALLQTLGDDADRQPELSRRRSRATSRRCCAARSCGRSRCGAGCTARRSARRTCAICARSASPRRSTRTTPSRCCARSARWCGRSATAGWRCSSTRATA